MLIFCLRAERENIVRKDDSNFNERLEYWNIKR